MQLVSKTNILIVGLGLMGGSYAKALSRVGGTITGAEAVNKSFPDFFDRLRGLGIEVNEHAAGI